MTKLQQNAGRFAAEAYTNGAPIRVELTVDQQLDRTMTRLTYDDLHDLRFVCERMISKLDAHNAEQRRMALSYIKVDQ